MNQSLCKIQFLLFSFLFCTYSYFYHTGQHNESSRFDQIRAAVEDGTWSINKYAFNSADIIQVNGKIYPNKPPGTTLLGIFPWIVFKKVLSWLPIDAAAQLHLLCYLVTASVLGFFSALLGSALFGFLVRAGNSRPQALLLTLLYSLGTIAFPFSTVYFSHQLTASFLFFAFYLVYKERRNEGQFLNEGSVGQLRSAGRFLGLFIAGFLLGFAPILDYPAALGCALIGLYACVTVRPWRRLGLFILGGMIAGSILLLYNWTAFQSAFYVTYSAYTEGGNSVFTGHKKGFMGVGIPNWETFLAITFKKQRGLFYVNPWLVLFFPGVLTLFWAKGLRKELLLCTALVVAFLAFNAGYGVDIVYWGGGYSVGPRHIIPMLPFMVIPIAVLSRNSLFRTLTVLLGGVSVFVMLLAAAVEPRVPYEVQDPIFDFFLRNYLLGRFALCESGVFSQEPLFASAGSFNLAKALGLAPRAELLPLAFFWAVLLPNLFRCCRNADGDTPGGLKLKLSNRVILTLVSVLALGVGFLPLVYDPFRIVRPGYEQGLLGTYAHGALWQKIEGTPDERKFPPETIAFTRLDPVIDFAWSFRPEQIATPFSILWTGEIFAPSDGDYAFMPESDDGSAVYVDGKIAAQNWGTHSVMRTAGMVHLARGYHAIRVYYENVLFSGMIRLLWGPPGLPPEIVPTEFLSVQSH